MEKIPDSGPALIVYYHGAIPIDYYYFLANVIIQKGRTCHSVGDHFLFKIPGLLLRTPPPPTGFLLSDVLGTPEGVSQGPAKSHGVFISVTVLQPPQASSCCWRCSASSTVPRRSASGL